MKILLLGYGKEGKSAEKYAKTHFNNPEIEILENFDPAEIRNKDYSCYDIIFRSPSVPPLNIPNESSVTKYFFNHCPCPIIGVTGTKGKGTTCSLIYAILNTIGKKAYLVGNIGNPAIDILDKLKKTDVVIYEMSSFQLWDLEKSPSVAVVLRIEPDHLNIHKNFDDYVNAKSHIAQFQSKNDRVIYFNQNQQSIKIAKKSPGLKIAYPVSHKYPELLNILSSLKIPGEHNKENAEAALFAVSAYLKIPIDELIKKYSDKIKTTFENFKGLPHHIEFVKTINGVDYYDDSFSASYPSLDVALKAFPNQQIVLIAGGKDRGLDLTPTKNTIFNTKNLIKAILIGETKEKLAENEPKDKFAFANTLNEAVDLAKIAAEQYKENAIVLLSPGAASFDMFKDFYDRGEQFKQIVEGF